MSLAHWSAAWPQESAGWGYCQCYPVGSQWPRKKTRGCVGEVDGELWQSCRFCMAGSDQMCYKEHRYHEEKSRKQAFPGKSDYFSSDTQGRNCLSKRGIGRIQCIWCCFFSYFTSFQIQGILQYSDDKRMSGICKANGKRENSLKVQDQWDRESLNGYKGLQTRWLLFRSTDWRWLLNLKAEDALFPEKKKSAQVPVYPSICFLWNILMGYLCPK